MHSLYIHGFHNVKNGVSISVQKYYQDNNFECTLRTVVGKTKSPITFKGNDCLDTALIGCYNLNEVVGHHCTNKKRQSTCYTSDRSIFRQLLTYYLGFCFLTVL